MAKKSDKVELDPIQPAPLDDPEAAEVPAAPEVSVTNSAKAGYKTTEFYVTIATLALSLLAPLLGLEPDQVNETAVAVVQWVTTGAVAVAYVVSRFKVKQAAQ